MKKVSCFLLVLLFFVSLSFAEAKDKLGQYSSTEQQIQQTLQTEREKEQRKEREKEEQQSIKEKRENEQNEIKNTPVEKKKEKQEENKVKEKPPKKKDVPELLSEDIKAQIKTVDLGLEDILQSKTLQGEVGEQVKQIVQDQNTVQSQIKEEFNRLESRNNFIKFLVGIDYEAVKNLKKQIEQNQSRIERLFQLQKELSNKEEKYIVQDTVLALIQEDGILREKITSEEQKKSLFGWLFKSFTK